jgi:TolA-binding protein
MQIDVQKQIVKLEGEVKREFSQKLTANIDSLEKRVEDTIFQNKEAQCQIEENLEKVATALESVSRDSQGKQSRLSTDIAEQASTTYDKMLQYIDKLKVD